jgi:hypothetical protein
MERIAAARLIPPSRATASKHLIAENGGNARTGGSSSVGMQQFTHDVPKTLSWMTLVLRSKAVSKQVNENIS